MSVTYNSLVASIQNYAERTDESFVSEIPTFIQNTHLKLCREAKTIGFERYVSGTLQPTQAVLAKPARWRRPITFSIGTGTSFNTRQFLKLRTYEYINMIWPNRSDTATPLYYGDYDFNNLIISPTPDLNYPFELAYIELPVPLSSSQQTNWLTNYASDVLLYGSMMEAMIFLKNDERLSFWQGLYEKGVASLTKQDDESHWDRANIRDAD